jgi:hypothetical protein
METTLLLLVCIHSVFFENKPDYLSLLAKKRAAESVKTKLLKDGGVVTTEKNTGQHGTHQMDGPPLHMDDDLGLDRCGQKELQKISVSAG